MSLRNRGMAVTRALSQVCLFCVCLLLTSFSVYLAVREVEQREVA